MSRFGSFGPVMPSVSRFASPAGSLAALSRMASPCTATPAKTPVPPFGSFGLAVFGVPYQAISTRPSSPAAAQAKTLLWSPGVGMVIGVDQVVPSSLEKLYLSSVSPVIWHFTGSCGACAQTAYRLPALSMASVGKLAPVFAVGQFVPI